MFTTNATVFSRFAATSLMILAVAFVMHPIAARAQSRLPVSRKLDRISTARKASRKQQDKQRAESKPGGSRRFKGPLPRIDPRPPQPEPPKKNKKYDFNFKGFTDFKVVELGGTYAVFGFLSDSPTKKHIFLSQQPLSAKLSNGKWSVTNTSKIERSTLHVLNGIQTSHLVKSSHLALAKNLRPDTTYHVLIIPYGTEKTDLFFFTGNFKTRIPKLEVHFQKIEMHDDSDDLSSGEFRFEFFLNGQHAPNGKKLYHVNLDLGSGCNDKFDVKATVMGTSLTAQVTAWENDDDPIKWFGSNDEYGTASPFGKPNAGSGNTPMFEWVSSSKNLTSTLQDHFVTNASSGLSFAEKEQFSLKFSIYAHGKDTNDLRFRVRGRVVVTYE
ncbi:MAG: hypothetical protein IH991_04905 [Planctomycetes bacterium]|nr:hypothetical protein [Planctomycetota bacterium]